MFNAIFCDCLIFCIAEQINLYAAQQEKENLNTREDKSVTVVAILLLSGYCRVPQSDIYWAASSDTHSDAVARAMSRNRFREIFLNLPIADNASLNDDRYYKERP